MATFTYKRERPEVPWKTWIDALGASGWELVMTDKKGKYVFKKTAA